MGCQNGGSDRFEVWLVVIGAILGFALSIITTLVNKAIMPYYDRLFSAMKTIWINKVRKRQDNKAITPSPVKSPQ